jgi:hypothetical protein
MKKMTTLYVTTFKEPANGKRGRIFDKLSNEVREENQWVFSDPTTKAYRKLDGAAAAIINGKLYARYMVRTNKGGKVRKIPENGIPAQEKPDENTGQHPYWVPTKGRPEYKWHNLAFDNQPDLPDGTYELCGIKINQNKENLKEDAVLLNHNNPSLIVELPERLNFDSIKDLIENLNQEGIVFKNDAGEMCKIRKVDYKFDY